MTDGDSLLLFMPGNPFIRCAASVYSARYEKGREIGSRDVMVLLQTKKKNIPVPEY